MKTPSRLLFRRLGLVSALVLLFALAIPPLLNSLSRPSDPTTKKACPTIPDEENAARWLQAGADAIVWSKENQKAIGEAAILPYREWNPELIETVRSVLDNNGDALKILAKARNLRDSSYGFEDSQSRELRLKSALQLMRAARLLADQARMGFGSCDFRNAYGALETLGKMASTLEDECNIVAVLIGIGIDRIYLSVAADAVTADAGCPPEFHRIKEFMPETDLNEMLHSIFSVIGTHVRLSLAKEDLAEGKNHASAEELSELLEDWNHLIDTPIGLEQERVERLITQTDEILGIGGPGRSWKSLIGRAQSVQALRQEVNALIAIRHLGRKRGNFPFDRPDIPELRKADSFTGKPLLYTRNTDGSITLKINADERLLKYAGGRPAVSTMAPMTLPAP